MSKRLFFWNPRYLRIATIIMMVIDITPRAVVTIASAMLHLPVKNCAYILCTVFPLLPSMYLKIIENSPKLMNFFVYLYTNEAFSFNGCAFHKNTPHRFLCGVCVTDYEALGSATFWGSLGGIHFSVDLMAR